MAEAAYVARFIPFKTESEEMAARLLPEATKQMIENQLFIHIKAKLNLKPDAESYAKFIQEDGILAGMIGACEFLLNQHNDTVETLRARSSQGSQG